MKQVLLTFFGIVLLYSLVFNDKKRVTPAEKLNYLYENSSPDPSFVPDSSFIDMNFVMPDGIVLFASESR
jgi:hypothetical protein